MGKYFYKRIGWMCVALALVGCGNESSKRPVKPTETSQRIASIDVTDRGAQTRFVFSYSSDQSVTINIPALKGNVSIHQDINENGNLTEVISGGGVTNHFYDAKGNRMGSFVSSENLSVHYQYDEEDRPVRQVTVRGKDTLSMYEYSYEMGTDPAMVVVTHQASAPQTFHLKFDRKEHVLTNTFESVFPPEDLFWLGNCALYGKHHLMEATQIGETNKNVQPDTKIQAMAPRKITYNYTFEANSCTIRSTTDGTRNWSARIQYENY